MHVLGFLSQYTDLSLFLMRVVIAIIFGTSGFHHLQDPKGRAASLGLNMGVTVFLGSAELAAAVGMVLGAFVQYAALGLIVILIGAIGMKMIKWNTGFWGENSMGWHYDLMLVCMNLVIVCSGGGRYVW